MVTRMSFTKPPTPLEIFEFKRSWLPGHTVRLHSDVADKGKTWCRRQLERPNWSVTTWTDNYEHTFHFNELASSEAFVKDMGRYAKL